MKNKKATKVTTEEKIDRIFKHLGLNHEEMKEERHKDMLYAYENVKEGEDVCMRCYSMWVWGSDNSTHVCSFCGGGVMRSAKSFKEWVREHQK